MRNSHDDGGEAPPQVLTIAGSDSGGGAGIQADLKTMTRLNTYGMSVITAVTAQNTIGVQGVETLPAEFVGSQLDSIFNDLQPTAAKTGMLANKDIVKTVVKKLQKYELSHLVVDPVMVATSGDLLLEEEAIEIVREELLPLATLVTPNLQEAQVLLEDGKGDEFSGKKFSQFREKDILTELAGKIFELGPDSVLIKGGHLEGEKARDILVTAETSCEFSAPRLPHDNTHGTGCTYSAAIAAYLARGDNLETAVDKAKKFITAAIAEGFELGSGINPVNHLVNKEEGNSW